jgi:hypothetical protein
MTAHEITTRPAQTKPQGKQELEASEASFLLMWAARHPEYSLSYNRDDLILPFVYSGRNFRADFVHLDAQVCIEIQGGIYSNGKHGRASGIITDMQKIAIASINNWALIQVPAFAKDPFWFDAIAETITNRLSTNQQIAYNYDGEF